MSPTCKRVICILLDGGCIRDFSNHKMGYRVYDSKMNVEMKISDLQFRVLKDFFRAVKNKYFIDKNSIRRLRKNTWLKQTYLENRQKTNNEIHKNKNHQASI